MVLVRCEAEEGPRPGYTAVGVLSVEGHREYLAIEDRFLVKRNGEVYLPVGLIGRDPRHKTFLVQLPLEADSGANRVWVAPDQFLEQPDEVPV